MKKIGTITFHASYNYGSNLQAYALQEYIKKIVPKDYMYNIINLRTQKQKDIYSLYSKKKTISSYIKNIITFFNRKKLTLKQKNFEKFITEDLNVTKEYNSLEELKNDNLQIDYYISGSDQLWNINAYDFDWANYLEFAKDGKKISYAASFGPKDIIYNEEDKKRIKEDLLKYDYISVREQGSFENVKKITGIEPEIHMDPTILLSQEEWKKLIPKERMIKEKYILFYTLGPDRNMIKIVKEVSKILKLPVVITKFNNQYDAFTTFKKQYDTGPKEFLNLLENAELILSSSLHGTIFSIILNKPFLAIRGDKDYRMSTLLKKMNLENRTINENNIEEKCKHAYTIEFENANKLLEKEKEKSFKYLKKVLEIE